MGNDQRDELESARRDGTLRDPVTMWVVRQGDDLFVRAVRGRDGAWFRGTQARRQGRISAGGVAKDVEFADAEPGIEDEIDAAYQTKYQRYARSIVDQVITAQARAATLRLVPRSDS